MWGNFPEMTSVTNLLHWQNNRSISPTTQCLRNNWKLPPPCSKRLRNRVFLFYPTGGDWNGWREETQPDFVIPSEAQCVFFIIRKGIPFLVWAWWKTNVTDTFRWQDRPRAARNGRTHFVTDSRGRKKYSKLERLSGLLSLLERFKGFNSTKQLDPRATFNLENDNPRAFPNFEIVICRGKRIFQACWEVQ